MNFQQLFNKIKAIDEGAQMAPPSAPMECGSAMSASNADQLLTTDQNVEECGMDMMPHSAPKQSDSVTMNVSMNGSGAGGIRDLMAILKNIEQGAGDDGKDVVIGMAGADDMLDVVAAEEFENELNPDDYEVDDVVNPPSNDLSANNGDHRLRQTGLPRAQMESLVSKLAQQYQTLKEDSKLPEISAPTKEAALALGLKKFGPGKPFYWCRTFKVQDSKGGQGPTPAEKKNGWYNAPGMGNGSEVVKNQTRPSGE